MSNSLLKAVVILFAIIGVVAVIGVIGMWSMHGVMMGADHASMMRLCSRAMTVQP